MKRPKIIKVLPSLFISGGLIVLAGGSASAGPPASRSNSEACAALYGQTYPKAKAADRCRKIDPSFRFVDNANFDRCLRIYDNTYTKAAAADRCVEISPSFNFTDNPNYDKCFKIYMVDYLKAQASDRCIRLTRSFRFINNPGFDKCLGAHGPYDISKGADRCMRSEVQSSQGY